MRTEKAQLKADLPKMHKTTEWPAISFSMALHRNLDLLPVVARILVHLARILVLRAHSSHVQDFLLRKKKPEKKALPNPCINVSF